MLTIFIYGISTALILAGLVMWAFLNIPFGRSLVILTLIFTSSFQGWLIDKLFKQLKNQEKNNQ
jgi:hypothetical protein